MKNVSKTKILFVGVARICKQVAYVLDYQDYVIVENIIDLVPYADYEIYICQFRRQSKIKIKDKDKRWKIYYLEDICQRIDAAQITPAASSCETAMMPATSTAPVVIPSPSKEPFLKKTWRRLIHPVQTSKKIVLKLKSKWHQAVKPKTIQPSELFLRVLFSQPTNIVCHHLETDVTLYADGQVSGCCSATMSFGKMQQGSLDQVYNSVYARIIKLSSLNRSYCLCDLQHCNLRKCFTKEKVDTLPEMKTPRIPVYLELQTDQTCNLSCPMCRQHYFVPDAEKNTQLAVMTQKILASKWLDKVKTLCFAGNGEVFYSRHYRQLIISKQKRNHLMVITNGVLFNENNWNLIKDSYKTFTICVSVDAATAATYQKIRGGNWDVLMQNLRFIGNLRQQNKLKAYTLNFVVQRDNYQEMDQFMQLRKIVGADLVYFTHLNYSKVSAYSYQEYLEKSMLIKHQYLDYKLYKILQNPIFKDPEIDLSGLKYYLLNSQKKYRR